MKEQEVSHVRKEASSPFSRGQLTFCRHVQLRAQGLIATLSTPSRW